LVSRRAAWCKKHGLNSIIITRGGPWLDLYKNSGSDTIVLTDREHDFPVAIVNEYYNTINSIAARISKYDPLYFESYCSKTMFLTSTLLNLFPRAIGGGYIVQDKAFIDMPRQIVKTLVDNGLIYSMNEACFKAHELSLGASFTNKKIFPLPIEFNGTDIPGDTCFNEYTIVTIARLTKMKGYISGLISEMPKALEKNNKIKLIIVGSGEEHGQLTRTVKKLNLHKNVVFTGSIPENELGNVLRKAHVYVGMGTTLLIAARMKIPCVMACPWTNEAVTHGFFGEKCGFEVGEIIEGEPIYKCWDKIFEIFNSKSLRDHIGNIGKTKVAKDFDEDVVMVNQIKYFNTLNKSLINVPPPAFSITQGEFRRFIKRFCYGNDKAIQIGRIAHKFLMQIKNKL